MVYRDQQSIFCRKIESSFFEPNWSKIDHRVSIAVKNWIFVENFKVNFFDAKWHKIVYRDSIIQILIEKSKVQFSPQNYLKSNLVGYRVEKSNFRQKIESKLFYPKWRKTTRSPWVQNQVLVGRSEVRPPWSWKP